MPVGSDGVAHAIRTTIPLAPCPLLRLPEIEDRIAVSVSNIVRGADGLDHIGLIADIAAHHPLSLSGTLTIANMQPRPDRPVIWLSPRLPVFCALPCSRGLHPAPFLPWQRPSFCPILSNIRGRIAVDKPAHASYLISLFREFLWSSVDSGEREKGLVRP